MARRAALADAGDQQAKDGFRRVGRGTVGRDGRVRGVETPIGIKEIAAFGDGQRHDADRRIGHGRHQRGPVAGRDIVDHRSGHLRGAAVGLLRDHGGEEILRGEHLAPLGIIRHHAGAHDGPVVPLPRRKQPVQIPRLMRAVEVAQADVQNAGAQVGTGIAGAADALGKPVERVKRQPDGHFIVSLRGARRP